MSNQESSQLKLLSQQQKIRQIRQRIILIQRQKKFKQQIIAQIQDLKLKINISQNHSSNKNLFNNVNVKFQNFQSEIMESKNHMQNNWQHIIKNAPQKINNNKCIQTTHLRQIFIKDEKKDNLKQLMKKREQVYNQISESLSNQQPYIWQKIFDRVKKLARYKSKLSINSQISKKIKQSEDWIKKQTLKLQNNLVQKEIQQNCMMNLSYMKRIMAKKVNINDCIYQNSQQGKIQGSQIKKALQKLRRKYNEKIKLNKQNAILEAAHNQ